MAHFFPTTKHALSFSIPYINSRGNMLSSSSWCWLRVSYITYKSLQKNYLKIRDIGEDIFYNKPCNISRPNSIALGRYEKDKFAWIVIFHFHLYSFCCLSISYLSIQSILILKFYMDLYRIYHLYVSKNIIKKMKLFTKTSRSLRQPELYYTSNFENRLRWNVPHDSVGCKLCSGFRSYVS